MTRELRIRTGLGASHTVSREVAARHRGKKVGRALHDLLSEDVRDPTMAGMLSDPRVVIEETSSRAGEGPVEAFLSPMADWDDVVQRLEEAEEELVLARSHAGGAL